MNIDRIIDNCYIPTIVQILADGEPAGTGFFIAKKLVLTCAHVILGNGLRQISGTAECRNTKIKIKWGQDSYEAEVENIEYNDPISGVMMKDFAFIRILKEFDHPIVVVDEGNMQIGDECFAMGYPAGKPMGEQVTIKYEGMTNASLLKFARGQIQPGYSGAPILNMRTGRVCGILKRTRDFTTDLGGWGIPVSDILNYSSALFRLHRNTSVNEEWESCLSSIPKQPPIKVCFISSEYQPHIIGGLGVHVTQLTAELGKKLSVDVVLPEQKTGYTSQSPGVTFCSTCGTPSYSSPAAWLDFARQAAYEIGRIQPDVIHCHDWVTVLAGIKCRWLLKKPLIFHIHLPNLAPLCSSIENLGLICADLVTVNSRHVRQEILHRDLPITRIEIVPNGVNTNEFLPCGDWPEEEQYILFVGRLVKQKGVEFLIRAMFYIKEKFPHIRLKIVGDGEYESWLNRLKTNLMLSDMVEFLGHKSGQDLIQLYQKAQLVVVPSINEPFGMVALEAMACRRPVVASRTGGLKEIIEHGKTGFLAEPENYLDLAQWIMSLLHSKELRQQMGSNAYACANGDKYKWSSIAQQYTGYYTGLLKSDITGEPDGRKKAEAAKLIEQIKAVSKKMKSTVSNGLFDELFDWM